MNRFFRKACTQYHISTAFFTIAFQRVAWHACTKQQQITRRIQQIEDQLTLMEAKEDELSQAMASTNDASQLMDLQNQLDQLSQEQEELMEEWEVLSQGLE